MPRKPTGAKLALKPVHVWGIHVRLQVARQARDLALFDLALDSKLRGCDLVRLRVSDLLSPGGVKRRVVILQRKTGRPVQFEVTGQTHRSLALDRAEGLWLRRLAIPQPNEGRLALQEDRQPRACQILLGHTKLESTVRYLGVEVDDALELSEALEL